MDTQIDYRKLVEAALFMSNSALSASDLAAIVGLGSPGRLSQEVKRLMDDYNARDSALKIIEIDGKYLMTIRDEYASKVSSLAAGPDLSRPALRILAYINKNPGLVQSDLVKAFGSSTYDYMKELTEKEFVETKKFGRTKKIVTTNKFREYFNV